MSEALEIWEQPTAKEIYMIAGWRQWADGGSISSGLPRYLVEQAKAEPIGVIRPEGFYMFQIPGTHHLVRPAVKFRKGFPLSLETPQNELFYAGDEDRGVVFFIGDEPHLDAERYVTTFLEAARRLGVKRIVSFGGVYAELPYDKERMVSAIYSLRSMQEELQDLSVNLSDYEGGASIGSYICRRAGELEMEYVSFYAFVPTYDFSQFSQMSNSVRIENDYMAWHGVMRRVNHMLNLDFDLAELKQKGQNLVKLLDDKLAELDGASSQVNLKEYMEQLSDQFEEVLFDPLDSVWEEEFRRLFDDDIASS